MSQKQIRPLVPPITVDDSIVSRTEITVDDSIIIPHTEITVDDSIIIPRTEITVDDSIIPRTEIAVDHSIITQTGFPNFTFSTGMLIKHIHSKNYMLIYDFASETILVTVRFQHN